jgi:hypothetical protein
MTTEIYEEKVLSVSAKKPHTHTHTHKGRAEVQLHWFLTSALDGGQLYAPAALDPVKNHGTHWTGGWVGSRAGMDVSEWTSLLPRYSNHGASQPVARRYINYAMPAPV